MATEITRCPWCGDDPEYIKYHDEEWGKQVTDEQVLFEFLILEAAQCGLSWRTILHKRAGYRQLFAGFNPARVARFDGSDIERIAQNNAIIRHRGKIEGAVRTAQVFLDIQREYGTFYHYLYSFMPRGKPIVNSWSSLTEVPTRTHQSEAIARDLKKRGVPYLGPTVCYAYMQAVGMVNDHLISCSFR